MEKDKNFNQIIEQLWIKSINKNVDLTDLHMVIGKLIKQGLTSDYLIFTLKYVIKSKYNLKHPGGLKYYVEYEEIKKAYEKKNRKFIKMSDFTAVDTDDYPRYTYHAKKSRGFADIFGDGGG